MSRNRLYVLLLIACLVGYLWLIITYGQINSNEEVPGICLFKRITTIPCPSCGSTRSIISILKGDIWGAIYFNPFGLILLVLMVIIPFWILGDFFWRKSSLFDFYMRSEQFLKRPVIAGSAILIVLLNWIWTIYKGM